MYVAQGIRWMSEKFDGIRAYWDGSNLFTRKGNKIRVPSFFLEGLPPIALDGELW
jgi:DNA ligase-1